MSKTLMSYSRLYYVLVLFYILISALFPDIWFLGLLCIIGEYGSFQKLFWKCEEEEVKTQHQRRDVPTS